MSKPIGDPPTADELAQSVKSYFSSHSYGPFTCERVSDSYLVFTSQTYPVQFELRIQGDFEALEYDVYEVPVDDESVTLNSGTKQSDFSFNPSLTWDKHISRLLMSISGSINGGIRREGIEPRE